MITRFRPGDDETIPFERGLVLNSSTLFGSTLAAAALNFAQSIIVTRAFGPALYGVWATITSSAVVLQAFLGFRTTEALTRALIEPLGETGALRQAHLFSAALFTEIGARIVALLAVIVLSPYLAAQFGGGAENWHLYVIYGVAQFFTVLDAPLNAALRVGRRFFALAMLPVFTAALTLCGAALCKFGFGTVTLNDLVWIYFVAFAIRLFASAFLLIRGVTTLYPVRIAQFMPWTWFTAGGELKEFWRYMRFSFLSSSMTSILKNCDVFILGYFTSASEVGFYRLAKNLAALIQAFANSLSTVEFQDLAEFVSQHKGRVPWERIKDTTLLLGPASLAMAIIGSAVASPVIALCFSAAFVPSTASFIVLLWGSAVVTTLFWAQPLTLVLRLYRANLINIALTGAFSIAVIALLSPAFGAVGAAIGMALGWITAYIGYVISVWHYDKKLTVHAESGI